MRILAPNCTWSIKTNKTEVYITFDDGPHPQITPWVLEQLKHYNALGTFFMVGENAQKYPELVEQILSQGHKIGNHTHNHLKGWNHSTQTYLQNVEIATAYVPSTLFRPPYGRISSEQLRKLKQQFTIIMWSILTRDYNPKLNIKRASKRIRKQTKPGSIIVFHDSEKAYPQLKQLLPDYLQFCSQQGYIMRAL